MQLFVGAVGGDDVLIKIEVGVGLVAIEIAGPVVAVGLSRMGRIMAIMFDVAVGAEEHASGILQLAELCSGVLNLGECCRGIVQGCRLCEVVVGPEELVGEQQQAVGTFHLNLGETGVGDTAGIEQISPFGAAKGEPQVVFDAWCDLVDVITPVVEGGSAIFSIIIREYTIVDTHFAEFGSTTLGGVTMHLNIVSHGIVLSGVERPRVCVSIIAGGGDVEDEVAFREVHLLGGGDGVDAGDEVVGVGVAGCGRNDVGKIDKANLVCIEAVGVAALLLGGAVEVVLVATLYFVVHPNLEVGVLNLGHSDVIHTVAGEVDNMQVNGVAAVERSVRRGLGTGQCGESGTGTIAVEGHCAVTPKQDAAG